MSTIDREAYIAGLRELADRLEDHPDAPLPYEGATSSLLVMPMTPAEMAAAARCYGGDKVDGSGGIELVDGVPGLDIKVISDLAGVCELIDTGEVEEVEVEEVVTPAVTRTVTTSRPVLKRVCPDSLLALESAGEVA